MYTVYMLVFPNNKKYVGVTARSCEERWKKGHGYANHKELYRDIKKYGWDKIEKIILKSETEKEEAFKLEQHYIKKYDTTDKIFGYNKSIGGKAGTLGFHHTEEAKKKIKEASTGRKQSKESIEKIRAKRIKKVNVYDNTFNLLKTCESLREAEEFTGINNSNISAVCTRKYKQVKGFIFRYADDVQDFDPPKHRKPVDMYSLDGEFIKRWGTIKEASKELNIAATHITDCCKGKYKKSGGYIWRYAISESATMVRS